MSSEASLCRRGRESLLTSFPDSIPKMPFRMGRVNGQQSSIGGTLRGGALGTIADSYNSGTVQLSIGNLEEAERLLAESVRRNPDFEKAWNNLDVCLMRKRTYGEALECFRKALSMNPSYEIARLNFEECTFLQLAGNR